MNATTASRPSTLRALFVSSRPISWVNTAYPFGAATCSAAGRRRGRRRVLARRVHRRRRVLPRAYNLAMYGINDVFDYESDLRNPRKGGVEGALLDKSVHRTTLWAVVVTNVPFLVALVVLGALSGNGPWSWLVLAISVFAVIAYSAPGLRFKEKPFLDSLTSSTHFVSPAVYGLALAGPVWTGSSSRCASRSSCGAWPRTRSERCRTCSRTGRADRLRRDGDRGAGDRAPGVRGVPGRGRRAAVLGLPGPIAAIVVVPYALNVLPWWNVTDAGPSRRTRGGSGSSGSTTSPASSSRWRSSPTRSRTDAPSRASPPRAAPPARPRRSP